MNAQTMILEDGSEINLVHFQYFVPTGLLDTPGEWRIACTPALNKLQAHPGRGYSMTRSEDPRAVNCPLCKKAEQFKTASAANPMPWRAA